jgi:hypothetical protein
MNSGDLEFKTDLIEDEKVRRPFIYRKGVLIEQQDRHTFHFKMKRNAEYVGRVRYTAYQGGYLTIGIYGEITLSYYYEDASTALINYKMEVKYTADATTTGRVELYYLLLTSSQKPTYTLYLNKTGFAGWWWIILSGLSVLAVLIFFVTFSVIGVRSVTKNKKRSRKKKRK